MCGIHQSKVAVVGKSYLAPNLWTLGELSAGSRQTFNEEMLQEIKSCRRDVILRDDREMSKYCVQRNAVNMTHDLNGT